MGKIMREEEGFFSFFAMCLLFASVLMAAGLLYIARRGGEDVHHYEQEVQLRFDAEGFLDKAVADIETGKIDVEEKISGTKEIVLDTEENERGIHLKVLAKRRDTGIILMSVAEKPSDNTALFKTAQGLMEQKEEGYAWKCWMH